MGRLPSGTVTFLFTDIEGSTELLHELGPEAYSEALAVHRRALREAFASCGGVEVDTQGDAFFVAFPTAPGALAAAVVAQTTLAVGPIRVRMGLHTGTPYLTEEGYVGVDVHRAARIAAIAHGSQVLVSASTAALLDGEGLRDLGQHRLRTCPGRSGSTSSATASSRRCGASIGLICQSRRRRSSAANGSLQRCSRSCRSPPFVC